MKNITLILAVIGIVLGLSAFGFLQWQSMEKEKLTLAIESEKAKQLQIRQQGDFMRDLENERDAIRKENALLRSQTESLIGEFNRQKADGESQTAALERMRKDREAGVAAELRRCEIEAAALRMLSPGMIDGPAHVSELAAAIEGAPVPKPVTMDMDLQKKRKRWFEIWKRWGWFE